MKKHITFLICLMYTHTATAQLFDDSNQAPLRANEFFVGKEYGKPLVKVNLISGVQRPGVYHVPVGTDLAEIIAYAGGANDKAKLNDITIVRQNGTDKRDSLEINFERQLGRREYLPKLANHDVVHIPIDRSMDRTLNWVQILSSLASIALVVTVIDNQN